MSAGELQWPHLTAAELETTERVGRCFDGYANRDVVRDAFRLTLAMAREMGASTIEETMAAIEQLHARAQAAEARRADAHRLEQLVRLSARQPPGQA